MIADAMLFAVVGYILEAHGDVSLRHREAAHTSPASVGSAVHPGDTIRLARGATALLLCPDLFTTWQPAPRVESGVFERCPPIEERAAVRDGQPVLSARAAEALPWVRTPSNSAITTAAPVLRWEGMPGASRYRVTILEATNPPRPIWGPAFADGTTLQYSGRAFEPGVRYFVRVEANGATADGKAFFVASPELRAEAADRAQHFERTIPDARVRDIAMSMYLRSRELRADALPALERAMATVPSPALKLLHARCLGEIGDAGGQWNALQSALATAPRSGDAYTEAIVLQELARLSTKRDEAAQLAQRATDALRKLGIRQLQGGD